MNRALKRALNVVLSSREAFDLRHEIKESTTHAEAGEFEQNNIRVRRIAKASLFCNFKFHKNSRFKTKISQTVEEPSIQTVTVEDQTAALNLCGIQPFTYIPWNPDEMARNMLMHYAERGDIQVRTFRNCTRTPRILAENSFARVCIILRVMQR